MTPEGESLDTIKLIERGIEHLNKLTIDVTQYSRERRLELETTDLHALLDASLELVSDKLAAKNLRVERLFAKEAAGGEIDADQLRQVFVNLLGNAADASAENAVITITTTIAQRAAPGEGRVNDTRRRLAQITIADTGSGMDARTLARLFEPFFTTKKRGTGLGLAVSRKIVEQHGGKIEVESTANVGTRFHVNIPL
jgi:signal transduction histidine kinase